MIFYFCFWEDLFPAQVRLYFSFQYLLWGTVSEIGGATSLSFILMATAIPSVILSPFAGVWADRWKKKLRIIKKMKQKLPFFNLNLSIAHFIYIIGRLF